MIREFKAFLIKQNMLALAIAVVIGAATNDVVQGLVNDFIMPIINAISPTKAWQDLRFPQAGAVQIGVTSLAVLSLLMVVVPLRIPARYAWLLVLLGPLPLLVWYFFRRPTGELDHA